MSEPRKPDEVLPPNEGALVSGARTGAFEAWQRERALAQADTPAKVVDLTGRAAAIARYEASEEKALLDLGTEEPITGVVVEHGDAVSSFPRGLVARTSLDGASWSEPESLVPRPSRLMWSDEGLLGASLADRVFLFSKPRRARFVELTASPRHPRFPWVVRKATALLAP